MKIRSNFSSDLVTADRIDILLSTYNGSKHLNELLKSIAGQSHENWCLFARDDGSEDQTSSILSAWQAKDPRIHMIQDQIGNIGPVQSFGSLLLHPESKSPYIAFADQDDVWKPKKLERLLTLMRAIPDHSQAKLVHADMTVTDEANKLVAESYWRHQHINPSRSKLPQLLVQNVVSGCALLANRALINLALPVPKQAVMHDWWLALVASAFGTISHVKEPLVFYRQHNHNHIGAKSYRSIIFQRLGQAAFQPSELVSIRTSVRAWQGQAGVFFHRFSNNIADERALLALQAFMAMGTMTRLAKIKTLARHSLWRNGFARNFAMALSV